jgi:hypothetical protein
MPIRLPQIFASLNHLCYTVFRSNVIRENFPGHSNTFILLYSPVLLFFLNNTKVYPIILFFLLLS